MKQLNTFNFILSGFFVLLIALTFSTFSQAEEVDDQKINVLESQMSQLIESQNELTLALSGVVNNDSPNLEGLDDFKADLEPQQMTVGDGTEFPPYTNCGNGHQEWPSSGIYKKSEWQMEEFSNSVGNRTMGFQDLNGDGLVDHYNYYHGSNWRNSCVYMNDGEGWDLVHKCYAKENNNVWTFWGDCAQA